MALIAIILASGVTASAAMLTPTPTVVRTTFCDDKPADSVVQVYSRGPLSIPLRCGTATYGFRHVVLRGRWNDRFSAQIALAISRGQASPDGTIYETFDAQCNPLFRVVANPRQLGAPGGGGVSPQGIITAYSEVGPNQTFRGELPTAPEPASCPMIVPIAKD